MFVAALLVAFAAPAAAADIRQGSDITIPSSETINDDLYAFGQTITILGTVKGDVIAVGNTINIDGTVSGNVMVAGNLINVRGPVSGTIRAAGNMITVDGTVGGDVVFAGNSLAIGSGAKVARDVFLGGTSSTVSGSVGRDVRGGGATLVIDGSIGRDVNVEADKLELTSRAVVAGNLSYGSANEANVAQGATVRGSTQRREPQRTQPTSPSSTPTNKVIDWLRGLVGLVILGFLLLMLAPGFVRHATDRVESNPAASLGIGLVVLIGVPVFAILAFIVGAFIGGWWIGLIALALYGVLFAVALAIVSFAAGEWILARLGRTRELAIGLAVGAAILLLVGIVPVLGGLIVFLAVLVGMGAIAVSMGGPREPAPAAR